MLTLLASSVADSEHFKSSLSAPDLATDSTVDFVVGMVGNKAGTNIYNKRVALLLKYFRSQEQILITGIRSVDIINTTKFTARKFYEISHPIKELAFVHILFVVIKRKRVTVLLYLQME